MQEKQIRLEEMFHKNQEYSVLKKEFSDPEIISELEKIGIPISFGIKVLIATYQNKRIDIPTLGGMLINNYKPKEISEYLLKLAESNLIDYDPNSEQFVTIFDIDPKVKKEIDMYQFPLPMIVEPKKIKNNHTNGYLKVNNTSLLLNHSYHNEDICLDHINRVNRIPLTINLDVAYNVKNQWKNLDKRTPKESQMQFRNRVKAFEKYMHTAYTVMEVLNQEGNKIYLPHAYDKRGRTYSRGYHVLDQGNDWNKACVEFFHKEFID